MVKYVIIGGSKGIGASIIERLPEEAKIINCSRTQPADLDQRTTHVSMDILEDDLPDVDDISHLIYCPGSINLKPISSLKLEDFRKDMEINVFGAIKAIKKYQRKLSKQANASITLFSTVAVAQGMPYHASISAAKGAIEGLTKALAAELAPKVRVNCIAPSITQTPLAAHILRSEEMIKKMKSRHPLQDILQPEELADMAIYLTSASSKNISGQVMHIDAGMSTLRL